MMQTLKQKLDSLVKSGTLKNYSIDAFDENGKPGTNKGFRNTERLILEFPNGEHLSVGTFCSGSAENTCFVLEELGSQLDVVKPF